MEAPSSKVTSLPKAELSSRRFTTWRDLVITPSLQGFTLLGAAGGAFALRGALHLGLLESALIFYFLLVVVTLVVLAVLRTAFPIRAGIYSLAHHPVPHYLWNLQAYLCVTNLWPLYSGMLLPPIPGLFPPVYRKHFYWMLGAKMARGITVIGGKILDPYLVTIGKNVVIGDDAMILPHAVTNGSSDLLVLGPISIGDGAVIGARSILLPGVIIGEGATVNAMSLVPMNTHIAPYEVWGGVPAVKLSASRRAA